MLIIVEVEMYVKVKYNVKVKSRGIGLLSQYKSFIEPLRKADDC